MRSDTRPLHQSLLAYRQYRYAWWALTLALLGWLLYLVPNAEQPANGGTWQGYVLGSAAGLLIVWLCWLGVRKRRYHRGSGTVQGWVSAHVYLGVLVLWLATLHCAFQFGWNLHSLTYALLVLVVVSGLWGVWAYLTVPARMTANRGQQSRADTLRSLAELDQQCLRQARLLDAEVAALVQSALDRTVVGGGLWQQLTGRDFSMLEVRLGGTTTATRLVSNADQSRIIQALAERTALSRGGQEVVQLQELLWLLARRKALLQQVRTDIRWQAWLQVWLLMHVPLSLGLLIALAAHIFSVFYYW